MTEEIIIDGVNVAGWTDEEVYYKFEHHTSKAIKQIAFDLYKQLKRAEIEIEKLKGVDGSVHPDSAYYKIARLEQENLTLAYNLGLKEGECEKLKKGYEKRGEIIKTAVLQRDKYRSALEEIREKAQHCIKQDVCALCDYSKECAVPDTDGLVYDNNRLLIKLINEVLND